jgi:hypothetical protein
VLTTVPDPRVLHYGDFYGVTAIVPDDRPIALVHGNCQAEAIRMLLDGADLQVIRIPPVFELTPADLPHLTALVARADLLVTQPVRDDYNALPVGTRQLAALLRPAAPVVVVPVVRWAGLHPYAVIVRDPADRSRQPPGVPYHDLRTLAAAAGLSLPEVSAAALRAVGEWSLAELRRRERVCDVAVSDLLADPQPGDLLTLNHPGNRVLRAVAARVRAAVGVPASVPDPGRTLLGEVVAPIDDAVLAATGLPDRGPATADRWIVRGAEIADSTVRQLQSAWYAEHPAVVAEGLRRHAATLDLLGAR